MEKKNMTPITKVRRLVIAHKYVPNIANREWPVGDSMTVPDESYSIKELLTRFTKGIPPSTGYGEGQFTGDMNMRDFDSPDLEKVKHYDLTEKMELRDQLKVKNEELRKRAEADEKSRREKSKNDNDLLEEIKNDYKKNKKVKAAGVDDKSAKPAEGGQE